MKEKLRDKINKLILIFDLFRNRVGSDIAKLKGQDESLRVKINLLEEKLRQKVCQEITPEELSVAVNEWRASYGGKSLGEFGFGQAFTAENEDGPINGVAFRDEDGDINFSFLEIHRLMVDVYDELEKRDEKITKLEERIEELEGKMPVGPTGFIPTRWERPKNTCEIGTTRLEKTMHSEIEKEAEEELNGKTKE